LLENLMALPTWAQVLILLAALAPVYRVLRTRVFKTTAAARADLEFAAWREVLEPHGWRGEIERGLTTDDIDLVFTDERSSRTRSMRLFGSSGMGVMDFYGETNGLKLEIDLEEAREVGALDALRVTRHAAMVAGFLGRDGEEALASIPSSFEPGAGATLRVEYSLDLDWSLPWSESDDAQATRLGDRGALYERMTTLERALIGREPRQPGPAELGELARSGGPIAPTLAARVLLALHPESAPARSLVDDLAAGRLDDALTRWLPGCVFDDEVVAALGLTREEHIERAREAIVRADDAAGPALARAALDAFGVEDLVGQGLDPDEDEDEDEDDEDGDLTYQERKARAERRARDAHVFACHVVAAFCGSEDADAFEDAYARVIGQIEHDFEFTTEFAEVMGDLDDWYPQVIQRALAYASNDDVYCYWAGALDEVWDDALAARLVALLESQEDGVLEARGLVAILEAATARDHVRMLTPARIVHARVEEDWSSDDEDRRALRAAIKGLEARLAHARRDGGGQLSLSEGGDAGGLSLANQGAEGDLEVVLDLADEAPAEEDAEAEADEPAAW
jgi:hypothetical protein